MTGEAERCADLARRAHLAATHCAEPAALAGAHVALALHASMVGDRTATTRTTPARWTTPSRPVTCSRRSGSGPTGRRTISRRATTRGRWPSCSRRSRRLRQPGSPRSRGSATPTRVRRCCAWAGSRRPSRRTRPAGVPTSPWDRPRSATRWSAPATCTGWPGGRSSRLLPTSRRWPPATAATTSRRCCPRSAGWPGCCRGATRTGPAGSPSAPLPRRTARSARWRRSRSAGCCATPIRRGPPSWVSRRPRSARSAGTGPRSPRRWSCRRRPARRASRRGRRPCWSGPCRRGSRRGTRSAGTACRSRSAGSAATRTAIARSRPPGRRPSCPGAGIAASGPGLDGVLGSAVLGGTPRLRISTLGRFVVERDGEQVDGSAWQSRKARELLKILVSASGRPVPRERLIDLLWPDECGERLANRLAVATATLRRVLDPDRVEPAYHVVLGADETLALDLRHVEVDVLGFVRDARVGLALLRDGCAEAAQASLSCAVAGYAGDYLPENLYDDWSAPLREQARDVLLLSLRGLTRLAEREPRHRRGAALRATGDRGGPVRGLGAPGGHPGLHRRGPPRCSGPRGPGVPAPDGRARARRRGAGSVAVVVWSRNHRPRRPGTKMTTTEPMMRDAWSRRSRSTSRSCRP